MTDANPAAHEDLLARMNENDDVWLMARLRRLLEETEAERDELQRTFDLMWDADQRAIKRWQDAASAGEGRSLTWPDRSKLTEWLLNERDRALRVVEAIEPRAAILKEHPAPWHVEEDWTVEIMDAAGNIVAKIDYPGKLWLARMIVSFMNALADYDAGRKEG